MATSKALGNVWKLRRVFDVTDPRFGAKADGVTNDYTAVNDCITAAGTSSIVYFPVGDYKINSPLVITSRVILQGENSQTTQLIFTGIGANAAITVNGGDVDGTTIRDLLIKGSATQTHGVRLNAVHHWAITQVKFENFGSAAMSLYGSYSGRVDSVQVNNGGAVIELLRNFAVGGNASGQVTCVGILSAGITGIGALIQDTDKITFDGCEMVGNPAYKVVNTTATRNAGVVTISGGYMANTTAAGSVMQIGDGVNGAPLGVIVEGALIAGGGAAAYGIRVYDGDGIQVDGNVFADVTTAFRTETSNTNWYVGANATSGVTNYIDWNGTVLTASSISGRSVAYSLNVRKLGAINGTLDQAKTSAVIQHTDLIGSRALTNNTTSAVLDLAMVTGAGNDDAVSVNVEYWVQSTTAGTHSVERGQVVVVVAQEGTPTISVGGPTKFGDAQVVIGGGTYTITWSTSTASNVVTLSVNANRSTGAASTIFICAKVLGGSRTGTLCSLNSMTAAQ